MPARIEFAAVMFAWGLFSVLPQPTQAQTAPFTTSAPTNISSAPAYSSPVPEVLPRMTQQTGPYTTPQTVPPVGFGSYEASNPSETGTVVSSAYTRTIGDYTSPYLFARYYGYGLYHPWLYRPRYYSYSYPYSYPYYSYRPYYASYAYPYSYLGNYSGGLYSGASSGFAYPYGVGYGGGYSSYMAGYGGLGGYGGYGLGGYGGGGYGGYGGGYGSYGGCSYW
jgi:hypothetical protein